MSQCGSFLNHEVVMHTDWEHLPYFLAVAKSGSLRGAAAELGTTHLKVNRQLAALEASYGTELVRRDRRGATLTEAGLRLLPLVDGLDSAVGDARRTVQGLDSEEAGDVRFSASGPLAQIVCAPILSKFSEAYPNINLIPHVSTALDDPNLFQTDVSLRMIYGVSEEAVVRKLFPVTLGYFASSTYIQEAFPSAGKNGAGLHMIGGPVGTSMDWIHDGPFSAATVRHNVSDPMLHLAMAAAGVGITRLALFMANQRPNVLQCPGTILEAGPPLTVIIHPKLKRTVRVRRFVDFLVTELQKKRSEISRI